MRISRGVRVVAGAAGLLGFGALARVAVAQVPGVPVLQNAFLNSGLGFAANLSGGGRQGGGGQGYLGAAVGYGLSGGKLQLSAGAGSQRSRGVNRGAYGIRAAANVWNSRAGSLGAGAFVGVGGAPQKRANDVVTNPSILSIPAGISVGYKRPMGATRGVAVYASPFYSWVRADSGTVVQSSAFRFSTGLDFAFSQSFGVTVGGEFGSRRGSGGGSNIGLGLTFVPGRR